MKIYPKKNAGQDKLLSCVRSFDLLGGPALLSAFISSWISPRRPRPPLIY